MAQQRVLIEQLVKQRGANLSHSMPLHPTYPKSHTSVNENVNKAEDFIGYEMPQIGVVGIGGGGCNSVERLLMMGVEGAKLIGINTDVRHLYEKLDKRIYKQPIGERITHGKGAGGDPTVGRKCAEDSSKELNTLLADLDLVFLTAGMGGGTGSGAAPAVAQIAKDQGAIVVAAITFPFRSERGKRIDSAKEGISQLVEVADTVIIVDNQQLFKIAPNMPLNEAFNLADEIVGRAVGGITETIINKSSLINIDFEDLRSVMGDGRIAAMSVGMGYGKEKVEQAIHSTLNQPLLDVNYDGATDALIHVTGSPGMTVADVNNVVEGLTEKMAPEPNIIIGARIDPELGARDEIQVIFIVTGVQGVNLLGKGSTSDLFLPEGARGVFEIVGKTSF